MLSPGEVHQRCRWQDSSASMWKSHQWWVARGPGGGGVLSVGLSGVDEGEGKMMPSERVAMDTVKMHVHVITSESGRVLRSRGQ